MDIKPWAFLNPLYTYSIKYRETKYILYSADINIIKCLAFLEVKDTNYALVQNMIF